MNGGASPVSTFSRRRAVLATFGAGPRINRSLSMSVSSAWQAPSLRASIMAQLRVIVALMIREGQSSYTQETLGFFWVIADPLILTCGVIAIWTLGDRTHGHASVSIVAMGLSAYTHLQLWRLGVLPCINIIHNSG